MFLGDLRERLLPKAHITDNEDDCWLWKNTSRRYGNIASGCAGLGILQAHRASYLVHIGPIPNGLNVLHSCDNTLCINPKHLFLGTQADNVDDMIHKGRQSFGGDRPKFGEDNPVALLTTNEVIEIKKLLAEGKLMVKEIATMFKVSRQAITNIKTGRRWSHI
jgi:hypothetical protein